MNAHSLHAESGVIFMTITAIQYQTIVQLSYATLAFLTWWWVQLLGERAYFQIPEPGPDLGYIGPDVMIILGDPFYLSNKTVRK